MRAARPARASLRCPPQRLTPRSPALDLEIHYASQIAWLSVLQWRVGAAAEQQQLRSMRSGSRCWSRVSPNLSHNPTTTSLSWHSPGSHVPSQEPITIITAITIIIVIMIVVTRGASRRANRDLKGQWGRTFPRLRRCRSRPCHFIIVVVIIIVKVMIIVLVIVIVAVFHRWNRNLRLQPQEFSRPVFLIEFG